MRIYNEETPWEAEADTVTTSTGRRIIRCTMSICRKIIRSTRQSSRTQTRTSAGQQAAWMDRELTRLLRGHRVRADPEHCRYAQAATYRM